MRKTRDNQTGTINLLTGIYKADQTMARRLEKLAARLGLPILDKIPCRGSVLMVAGNGLSLMSKKDRGTPMQVRVDFTDRDWQRRLHCVRGEQLIKAMGRTAAKDTAIIDATGGLGRDGFLLAAAGYRVVMIEKNPVLAALVEDGLFRAADNDRIREICSRITFHFGDARLYMQQKKPDVEIVYLDPMFPEQKKTAKVKKELQMIRYLAGGSDNMAGLFHTALETASRRVVVKRPQPGPWLANLSPSYSVDGKTIRFDIYLRP